MTQQQGIHLLEIAKTDLLFAHYFYRHRRINVAVVDMQQFGFAGL